jgi:hypothetical protein
MNEDPNPVLALKNAWTAVVDTSAAVHDLGPAVAALDDRAPLTAVDLDAYHRATLAQSIAVMALRGLIEQLQRRAMGQGMGQ